MGGGVGREREERESYRGLESSPTASLREMKLSMALSRDDNGAGLGWAPLSHTRPKIFNYFSSPSQIRNGAGFSFSSPIRMPLKISYPLPPVPSKFKFGFRFLIPYTFQISQKLFSEYGNHITQIMLYKNNQNTNFIHDILKKGNLKSIIMVIMPNTYLITQNLFPGFDKHII